MPLDGHPQPLGAGPAGGSGAGAGLFATDGATLFVLADEPEAGVRVTVSFPEDEVVVVDDATVWFDVEPERPSKRIV
ncbi:hypothetical protein D3C85_1147700 [compost metagenome]